MGLDVVGTVKTVFITIAIIGFNYFVIPFIFPVAYHQSIYFSITTTIANVSAIILSWYYFSKSGCLDDEVNIMATYLYKAFGPGATHLAFYIWRVSANILMIVLLLTYPGLLTITLPAFFNIKVFLLSYSIGNGMYVHEAINNFVHVSNGVEHQCNDKSWMCTVIDDPLFCGEV